MRKLDELTIVSPENVNFTWIVSNLHLFIKLTTGDQKSNQIITGWARIISGDTYSRCQLYHHVLVVFVDTDGNE